MLDKITRDKVLELNAKNKSLREIASELKIGKTTVASIIKKAAAAVAQPEPQEQKQEQAQQSPELIITESSIDMNKGDADNFLNGLLSDGPDAGAPPPDLRGQDAFLNGLISEININEKPKGRKPKVPAPPKVQKAAKLFAELPVVRQEQAAPPKPAQLEKGELIAKLTLAANTFPDLLKDYIKPNKDEFLNSLQKKSQVELSALMSTMDYTRAIHNTAGVLKSLTITGASLLESGTKRFLRMRTDGFTALLSSIPDLDGILKEVAMENQGGIISKYQSPSVRLTTLIITTLLAVDSRNRSGMQQAYAAPQPAQDIPMATDLEQKYNEL